MESFESEGSTFHFVAGGAAKNQAGIIPETPKKRPPYRPPVGVPLKKGRELGGKVAAVAFHVLLLLLLLTPLTSEELRKEVFGAGGAGPSGGGGGGSRGTGGGSHKVERTTFVKVTPPPPPPRPTIVPPVTPPVVKPPEVKPPEVPKTATPTEQKVETKTDLPPATTGSVTSGVGGGAGNDGSAGSGLGRGGGIGSGDGTGKGSGTGPGTGGGAGTIYPPTPTELFIPPMPPPSKIKGFELIAQFDVDSTGKVVDFQFTKTKDSGYNKKLEEILGSVRFRPGVNGLGVPVRAKTQIVYTF